jgi:hypothetical protein
MNMGSKYLLLLLFFSFLALLASPYKLPQEFVDIPENVTYNESTELPLMSNQDDLPASSPAENKLGWWKHTGDSSVSYAGGISIQNPGFENKIDLEILVNGEDADSLPGPNLPAKSPINLEYIITNRANHSFYNLSVSDDYFEDVDSFAFLDSGEQISFNKSLVAKEGQFTMKGFVHAQAINSYEIFTDSDMLYYYGINGSTIPDDSEEIPEFPNIVLPMMAILCMSLIFGKNK